MDGGEPANGTGEVDIVEEVFAAVSFDVDEHVARTAPAGQRNGRGSKKDFIRLRAEDGGDDEMMDDEEELLPGRRVEERRCSDAAALEVEAGLHVAARRLELRVAHGARDERERRRGVDAGDDLPPRRAVGRETAAQHV